MCCTDDLKNMCLTILTSTLIESVNVDDAVDDIVRQFKGVSDGLIRAVAGPSSYGPESSITSRNLNWDTDELNKLVIRQSMSESINSYSDTDDGEKYTSHGRDDLSASQAEGWRSDNELDLKGNPTSGGKYDESIGNLDTEEIHGSRLKSESSSRVPDSSLALTTVPQVDLTGVPPEVLFIEYFTSEFLLLSLYIMCSKPRLSVLFQVTFLSMLLKLAH